MKNLGYLAIIVICVVGFSRDVSSKPGDPTAPIGALLIWGIVGVIMWAAYRYLVGDNE